MPLSQPSCPDLRLCPSRLNKLPALSAALAAASHTALVSLGHGKGKRVRGSFPSERRALAEVYTTARKA